MCTIEALLRGPVPQDDRAPLFIQEFLTLLLDLQPPATSADAGLLCAYVGAVSYGVLSLYSSSSAAAGGGGSEAAAAACTAVVPTCIQSICAAFLSAHPTCHAAAAAAVKRVCNVAFTPAAVAAAATRHAALASKGSPSKGGGAGAGGAGVGRPTMVENVCSAVASSVLHFRTSAAWPHSLPALTHVVFRLVAERGAADGQALGIPSHCVAQLGSLVEAADQMADATHSGDGGAKASQRALLVKAVGVGIEHVGAERVLAVLPLQQAASASASASASGASASGGGGLAESRQWLVPVLRQYMTKAGPVAYGASSSSSRLAYFQSNIISLALLCEKRKNAKDPVTGAPLATASEQRHQAACSMQLWYTRQPASQPISQPANQPASQPASNAFFASHALFSHALFKRQSPIQTCS
jgi:hypothetical protein